MRTWLEQSRASYIRRLYCSPSVYIYILVHSIYLHSTTRFPLSGASQWPKGYLPSPLLPELCARGAMQHWRDAPDTPTGSSLSTRVAVKDRRWTHSRRVISIKWECPLNQPWSVTLNKKYIYITTVFKAVHASQMSYIFRVVYKKRCAHVLIIVHGSFHWNRCPESRKTSIVMDLPIYQLVCGNFRKKSISVCMFWFLITRYSLKDYVRIHRPYILKYFLFKNVACLWRKFCRWVNKRLTLYRRILSDI